MQSGMQSGSPLTCLPWSSLSFTVATLSFAWRIACASDLRAREAPHSVAKRSVRVCLRGACTATSWARKKAWRLARGNARPKQADQRAEHANAQSDVHDDEHLCGCDRRFKEWIQEWDNALCCCVHTGARDMSYAPSTCRPSCGSCSRLHVRKRQFGSASLSRQRQEAVATGGAGRARPRGWGASSALVVNVVMTQSSVSKNPNLQRQKM